MAKQPNKLFVQEFKQMMIDRFNMYGTDQRFLINNLPLPHIPSLKFDKENGAYVKGITEPYFDKLNKSVVNVEKRQAWTKKEYDQHGKVLMKDGKPVVKDVTIPMESVVVSSSVNIELPNVKVVGVSKQKYRPSDGFLYVDYEVKNGVKIFYYAIPKVYLYKLNLCALILTKNTYRRAYKGYKIALQNGTYIYMYIIPYNPNRAMSYRLLGVKASPNFSNEVKTIIQWWQKQNVSFNYNLCMVENVNIAYSFIDGVVNVDDYRPYEHNSMGVMSTNNEDVEESGVETNENKVNN